MLDLQKILLKVGFFLNEDCLGRLCKVSSEICKLSEIQ